MKLKYGPREKFEEKGIDSLTDEEVLSILIKTGNRNMNVLELSKYILSTIDSIKELDNYSYEELMVYKGIGKAKSMTICAALELYKRIIKRKTCVLSLRNVENCVDYLKDDFYGLNHENLIVIFLNSTYKIISKQLMQSGSYNSVQFNQVEILKRALKLNAVFLIIAHNHPSGNEFPSDEDIINFDRIASKSKEFGIIVLDSYVFTDKTYFSILNSTIPIEFDTTKK